ncbi:hypothetical protein BHYA_0017g00460 [Botrytis hyacinthi]|uniref:AMP-dependent synthetase/ligase domain-containing protein n=1 Tax=Botrytis hyacinthi TaxID=278943 RepID=A0A4Z1GXT9_9HELO|nr:hypothetical protein BHYA_0017g00460 [Botrytis hyacinthi]
MVPGIVDACDLRMIHIPSLEDLLEKKYDHFTYHKTFAQARAEPLAVLHTSGTTGLPKPIIWSHDFAASWNEWLAMEAPEGYANQSNLWTSNVLQIERPRENAADQCELVFPISIPHPSIPDLWAYSSRSDDIIVLLTGEKTNPTTMEQTISHHPEVQAALLAGTARFQTALLIELVPSQNSEKLYTVERAHTIERIWPKIEEANQDCPQHAKVAKTHILFTTPEKPMERAGKGTIQRKPTLDLYSEELDKLYADADKMSTSAPVDISLPQDGVALTDSNSIALFIHNIIAQVTGTDNFQDGDDLFAHVGRSKGHGLETEFPTDRVTFLAADLSKKNLGLELKIYNELQEWLPRLVLTSVQLGIIPESLDATKETEVDWIPLDILASVLVESCLGDSDSGSGSGSVEDAGAKVFHPTNPVLTSWRSLISAINRSQDKAIEPVPFTLWIEQVKREAEKLDDATKLEDQLADIPAVKVMPFYEGLAKGKGAARLDNDRAMKMSKQLRELVGIKPEWMEEWVKSWLEARVGK